MRACQRETEFRQFFTAEREAIHRFAVFLTGDPELGARIAQDALVRTYRRWRSLRNEDPAQYARRCVLKLARSRGGWRPWRRHAAARSHAQTESAEWVRLATALATLSPPARAAVILRFHEQLTEQDIALVLDRPVGRVKADLQRAVRKLDAYPSGAAR